MSKLKGNVVISADLMDEIVDVLGQHCFSDDGEYNNEEVFNVLQRIRDEMENFAKTDRATLVSFFNKKV